MLKFSEYNRGGPFSFPYRSERKRGEKYIGTETEGERNRDRETETETERDRERQRETETERQRQRQRQRDRDRDFSCSYDMFCVSRLKGQLPVWRRL